MVKVLSIFKVNLLTALRYRANFIGFSISVILSLVPVVALLFNGDIPIFGFSSIFDYIRYLGIAASYWSFVEVFWSFVFEMRYQMRQGILEETLMLPLNNWQLVLGWTFDGLITTCIQTIPLLLCSLILSISLSPILLFYFFILLLISMLASFSLSLFLVSLMILVKEFDQVVAFFGNAAPLLCGLIVPITYLPKTFQLLSYFFPFTWALDLIRFYLQDGVTIIWYGYEWLVLLALLFVYSLVGYFTNKIVYRKARLKNTFVGY